MPTYITPLCGSSSTCVVAPQTMVHVSELTLPGIPLLQPRSARASDARGTEHKRGKMRRVDVPYEHAAVSPQAVQPAAQLTVLILSPQCQPPALRTQKAGATGLVRSGRMPTWAFHNRSVNAVTQLLHCHDRARRPLQAKAGCKGKDCKRGTHVTDATAVVGNPLWGKGTLA